MTSIPFLQARAAAARDELTVAAIELANDMYAGRVSGEAARDRYIDAQIDDARAVTDLHDARLAAIA